MVKGWVSLTLWGGGIVHMQPDKIVGVKEAEAGTSMIITGFNQWRVAQSPEEVMRRVGVVEERWARRRKEDEREWMDD